MKKIEKLTEKQEQQLMEFREYWLSIGLSCESVDKKRAEKAISYLYKKINKKQPYFWYVDSPLMAQYILNILSIESNLGSNLESNLVANLRSSLISDLGSNLGSNLRSNLESNLRSNLRLNLKSNLGSNLESNLWSNLGSNLRSNLGSNLWSNLESNLRSNLRLNLKSNLGSNLISNLVSNLESNLRSNLESNLWSNLESNLWSNLWSNLRSNLVSNLRLNLESNLKSDLVSNLWSNLRSNLEYFSTQFWGQHDSYWIAFYKYPEKYLGIKYGKEYSHLLNQWAEIAKSCCWFWAYENICIISDRPKSISKKGIFLHNETKPALEFRDGYSLWYLNGVEVPKEIVLTPASQLNPKLILTERNGEVRRELVRKIGIDRICNSLNVKILDSQNGYELLEIPIPKMSIKARYLKMKNPSISTYHIEGVHPNCKTVRDALHFRKPDKLRQIKIDNEKGLDWYQQGDVCVWPKDAHAVKEFPTILT